MVNSQDSQSLEERLDGWDYHSERCLESHGANAAITNFLICSSLNSICDAGVRLQEGQAWIWIGRWATEGLITDSNLFLLAAIGKHTQRLCSWLWSQHLVRDYRQQRQAAKYLHCRIISVSVPADNDDSKGSWLTLFSQYSTHSGFPISQSTSQLYQLFPGESQSTGYGPLHLNSTTRMQDTATNSEWSCDIKYNEQGCPSPVRVG